MIAIVAVSMETAFSNMHWNYSKATKKADSGSILRISDSVGLNAVDTLHFS